MTVTLRPYQQKIEDECRAALVRGDKKICVVAPTGSGKTALFADISQRAASKTNRVLILTHRREIMEQTTGALFRLGVVAGQIASDRAMTRESVQVAMVGTLIHRLGRARRPDLLIIDETHHAISPSWSKILKYWSDVPRIGFTATPERLDGRGLGEIFSTMILGPTTAQLVRDKWLAEPILYRPPHEITAKYHIKRGDFDQGEQEQKMSSRAIVGDVIDHYRQHLSGLPAVCFCVSVKHSYLMAEQFRAAGFTSAVVEGGMKKSDRDTALKGLADGSIQIVCSCDVISEGVDVPVMAGAILLRRTASLALYLQQAGRALRMSPGKTDAVILDHAGNYHLHGHVLADREWTLNARSRKDRDERPPAITTCPVCYGVWPGHPLTCPSCGFEFEEPRDREAKPLRILAGELVRAGAPEDEAAQAAEVYQRAMAAKAKDRQKILLGAAFRATDKRTVRALAEAIGYSAGWADWAWDYRTNKMR
jgi:DNA repair protein RadD